MEQTAQPEEKVDKRVSVNVTASEQRRLEQAAREEFRTVATLARMAICEYLERREATA